MRVIENNNKPLQAISWYIGITYQHYHFHGTALELKIDTTNYRSITFNTITFMVFHGTAWSLRKQNYITCTDMTVQTPSQTKTNTTAMSKSTETNIEQKPNRLKPNQLISEWQSCLNF
jgi:hypothetical protein